ncbi:hypothetical protein CPB86DRAFT_811314 [Serendipita vermifera]|nr:hypothetical protein CPB86DRAFT_811314 [Serendipita vermifera]
MPSILARILHAFLGDWASKDRRASNATPYRVRYRIACDAIDWAFDSGRPPFTAWAQHGSEDHNSTEPGTLVTLFTTSERAYRYIMPPELANYKGDLYLEARGAPFIAITWTRANPGPMDQCDDPGLFQTMNGTDVSTQTRTYTSREHPVTSSNTVIFTDTDQTARPIEQPPLPPFTSLPEASEPTTRSPLATEDPSHTNPVQSTLDPQTGVQDHSPSGIGTGGESVSIVSTRHIDGSGATLPPPDNIDGPGTTQGSGSFESPSVNDLPYVNGSKKNDRGPGLHISTPAGVIIGITAGLAIAGLVAFAMYRYRRSRRRKEIGSQERLVSKSQLYDGA